MITLLYIPQLFGLSIEVYLALFVFGVPAFFFWRWIFRKKISAKGPRLVAIWVAALFTAPVIYIGIIMLWFTWMNYYPKNDFDRKKWLADKETRYEMSKDMIKSKMLIGKTKKEVKALLGDEGNEDNNDYWHYYLGFLPEIANIDPDLLDITFKGGKVVEVAQHNS